MGGSSSTGGNRRTPPHGVARLGIARSFQRRVLSYAVHPRQRLAGGLCAANGPGGVWRGVGRTATPKLPTRRLACSTRWASRGRPAEPARAISHGEQRQLELAIGLAAARAFFARRAGAGLSPEETKRMVTLVTKLKGRYTIILIEQQDDVVMSMSDRIFGDALPAG